MRSFLKSCCRGFAILLVAPLLATHIVLSRLSSPDGSLEAHSQCLSCLPGLLGSYLRVGFYRFALAKCSPTATISFGVLFSKVTACIDEHVYIGPHCMLGSVTLERDVLLGPHVQIPSGPHTHGIERLDVPIRHQPGCPQRITVGQDSWIGAGSIVLADIATQTVVAAGAVVTKPQPPRTIIGGCPAKVLRHREDAPP
ncbi:acyltransferase [Roseimaritima ulvae]|uniref:Maltose O-acetyltransferase n=1 Tax=Roseimaritima ulvae TaxID=980254 RepID=A0A5B9QZ77_9BACT|nr:acyltransferase [Roseimaritima ulvae]QEG42476.1 Maltose O-acetyltransferase [Roseimaritima ulvae]